MTPLLGILAALFAAATALLLWRSVTVAKERDTALRTRDEAKTDAETVRRESKSAREELDAKRKEVTDLRGERDDLKKKIFDAKEEAKRRVESQARQKDDDRDTRYRELAAAAQSAREDLLAERKRREEADKALAAEREKVRLLEQAAARAAARPPREERRPAAPAAAPAEGAAPAAAAAAAAAPAPAPDLSRHVDELKRKLAESDRAKETQRRKADNANRIYLMTKSQLDLAQEKIATLGLRYAEAMAKLEGRPPPLGTGEPNPAQDAAAEAEALAAAMDETEPSEGNHPSTATP